MGTSNNHRVNFIYYTCTYTRSHTGYTIPCINIPVNALAKLLAHAAGASTP